jgi:hypothetical protein
MEWKLFTLVLAMLKASCKPSYEDSMSSLSEHFRTFLQQENHWPDQYKHDRCASIPAWLGYCVQTFAFWHRVIYTTNASPSFRTQSL